MRLSGAIGAAVWTQERNIAEADTLARLLIECGLAAGLLKQSEGAKYARIYAMGAARGDLTVTNDDIAGPIESSDEWIRQRTGVITRKRASKGITAADLATEAAKEAIAKGVFKPAKFKGQPVRQLVQQRISFKVGQ